MRRERISSAMARAPGSIWFHGPSDWVWRGFGSSRNANFNCITGLLLWRRLGSPAEESVSDGARLEQIADRAKAIAVCIIGLWREVWACRRRPVGPACWNERSTAIRQHCQQKQYAAALQTADDSQATALECVPLPSDGYGRWKIFGMGSLWLLPWTAWSSPSRSTGAGLMCCC